MKIHVLLVLSIFSSAADLALATCSSERRLSPLLATEANITTVGCTDITENIKDLHAEISSETCKFDHSGTTIAPNDADSSELYDKYYDMCSFICGCRDRFLSEGETVSTKSLVPVGQCDAALGALDAMNANMQEGCVTTQVIPILFDFFCEPPSNNPFEAICAGYYNYCYRRNLVVDPEEHFKRVENLSKDEIIEQITLNGGNRDGIYAKKEHVISKEACNKASEYLDEQKIVRTGDMRNTLNRRLTGEELISMIGKDNAKNLLTFFQESLGYEAPVTGIKIQRTDIQDEPIEFMSHADGVHTMITFLKDNGEKSDLNGGGLYHYKDGAAIKTYDINPGLTIVHGKDVIHTTYPWTGVRDILDISTNPSIKDAPCKLKDLVV